jgi:O-antigen/teichoic acid export membrane protein
VFIVLTNLTIAVRSYGDYLTLSLTRDERETGLYYYAFMMSQALARLALASIPSVLGPAFSKLKEDEARHAAAVTSGIHMFAIIGVLPIVLQAALAWPLFRLFFHAKWAPAAPLFAILSLVILVSFLNNVTFQAMWAGGHYRRFFYYSAAFTPVFLVAFLIGALVAGGTGVAWAGVIVQAADFVFFSLMALPVLKVPVRPVFAPLWRPLVAAIPAAAVALMLHALLPPTKVADIACIIISGFLGTLAYVGILLMLWRQPVLNVWNHLLGAMNLSSR